MVDYLSEDDYPSDEYTRIMKDIFNVRYNYLVYNELIKITTAKS